MKSLIKCFEYIPLTLILTFFLIEAEVQKQDAIKSSCNIFINIISIGCFYLVCLHFEKSKITAFITAVIIFIVLKYIKQNHLF
jgi:hypothetical protein